MRRREFLTQLGAVTASAVLGLESWAESISRDVKITRIVSFNLFSRRPKFVGKNSRIGVHGNSAIDRMVRIFTNQGSEGIGFCRADKKSLSQLLNKAPLDLYSTDRRRVAALGRDDMPLWDLVGKLLGKPVYELFGVQGRKLVPVYDGSIYFSDLLPDYESKWKDRFRREIDMGLEQGHRMFKIKIGRGCRWMKREEGDQRDVEVLRTIRAHGGNSIQIGIDANDGYNLEGAKRLMDQVGELDIAFTEEMFPETVNDCLELKKFYAQKKWKTLLADGEGQRELEGFKPFIEAGAIDILQGDMRHFGFSAILQEAAWANSQELLIAPHNWGSLIGYYMQLHVGRAISNFFAAENDPLHTELLMAEGYKIENGLAQVPEIPGFGLKIDHRLFEKVKVNFDLK